jgi:hypothetical protein
MYGALTRRCAAAAAAVLSLLFTTLPVQAQQPTVTDGQVAFVAVQLGWTEAILEARFWQGVFLLPVVALLRRGQVDAEWDSAGAAVSGYYIRETNRYRIDSRAGIASSAGREVQFSPADVIATPGDLFLPADLLEKIFGWQVIESLADLRVAVVTRDTFPADLQRMRASTRRTGVPPALRDHAPLTHPRARALLGGGVLHYGLQTDVTPNGGHGAYDIGVGMEVLGGGFQFRSSGRSLTSSINEATWRLALSDRQAPLASELAIGRLTGSGLSTVMFTGMHLTNAPLVPEVQQAVTRIEGMAGPRWDVELYFQGQLLDHTAADESGRYSFLVPVTYGSPVYTVRIYEPGGAVSVREERMQVPFGVLRSGRTEYRASLGRREDALFAQARIAYGLTDYFTAFAGYERLTDALGSEAAPPFAGVAFRLPHSLSASAEYAFDTFGRVSVDAVRPSGTGLLFTITDHEKVSPYNPSGFDRGIRGSFFSPLPVIGSHSGIRASGDWATLLNGTEAVGLEGDVSIRLGNSTLRLGSRFGSFRATEEWIIQTHEWRTTLNVMLRNYAAGPLRLLSRSLLTSSVSYDRRGGGVDQIMLEMSRSILGVNRLTAALSHSRLTGNTSIELRVQQHGRRVLSMASARRDALGSTAAASVRGSVGRDWERQRFELSARDWVGRAGAIFIPFLDADGDGAAGPDEVRLDAPMIRFREPVATTVATGGVIVATDLVPYRRYSVDIALEASPSPLWLPRDSAFSFVADPNTFKIIPVPFYVGGVVEGTVRGLEGNTLSGLSVIIRNAAGTEVARTRAFANGTFYHMGLPPGDYVLSLDPAELSVIRGTAQPRAFTIRITRDGDFATGVDLVVQR